MYMNEVLENSFDVAQMYLTDQLSEADVISLCSEGLVDYDSVLESVETMLSEDFNSFIQKGKKALAGAALIGSIAGTGYVADKVKNALDPQPDINKIAHRYVTNEHIVNSIDPKTEGNLGNIHLWVKRGSENKFIDDNYGNNPRYSKALQKAIDKHRENFVYQPEPVKYINEGIGDLYQSAKDKLETFKIAQYIQEKKKSN